MATMRQQLVRSIVVVAVAATWVGEAIAAPVDHSKWDQLLKRHVQEGVVDYHGFRQEQAVLEEYFKALNSVTVESLGSRQVQLAFWINAYNAAAVKGVLDRWPPRSVQGVGGFFSKVRYAMAGSSLTLNDVEARGRALGDWRIHMALVCAAKGCPPLRSEAYVPERLEEQLADQARRFLNDPQRGLRVEGDTLWLSSIFSWYKRDFVASSQPRLLVRLTPEAIVSVIRPYLDPTLAVAVQTRTVRIKWLDYDWSLNEMTR